jgi:hypothetical protein
VIFGGRGDEESVWFQVPGSGDHKSTVLVRMQMRRWVWWSAPLDGAEYNCR